MFNINIFNGKDPLNLYLSTPDKRIITCINEGIDTTSSNLSVSLNQQYELTFTYNSKVVDQYTGELNDSPGYDYLVEDMYLVLEHVGLFKMSSPVINSDGSIETKEITAKSCDCELEDKIFSAKINTGESDSQEFLVTYDADESELIINEYTGIPFDWIVLYNTFPEQLQILLTDYNNGFYGTANTDITITDIDKIKKLQEYLKLIPRLVTKMTKDSEGNISRSDYVIYTYDENNEDELIMMAISSLFGNRIKELISFYTKYRERLSLLTLALEKMDRNWTVGEIYGMSSGDYSLCNRKCSFDANEGIYSFLTQTLAQAIECVVYFDIINRTVNVIPADKIGNDTGIIMSYETLVNTVNISCDESNLATRLYVSGADDLGIEQVNYGDRDLDDLTYKISARDSEGKRIYVTDALAEKYKSYQKLREDNRDAWVTYTKEYNSYLDDIAEIQNRVPNGDLKNEWGNYSKEFLEETLKTYNNLLVALETMYKEDYGSVGLNTDGSINENYIQRTEYWYDYQAYKNIIVQIECAIAVWPSYSDETKWTQAQRDKYLDAIKAYETDWTLYGTDELKAKIATYNNNMKVLLDKETVCRVSEDSENIKSWSQLSDAEKNKYGSVEKTYTDSYDIYIENKNNRDNAQDYLDSLNEQIKSIESKRDDVQEKRQVLKDRVSYTKYFTDDEKKTLSLLYKDAEYTNENILTTSIDDSISTVDCQYELLRDAQEKLEMYSRPQLIFETEINNLLGLTEFQPFWNDFQLGNYIYIEFRDNTYMKTRLVNYQINPFNPDMNELTIGFSSFIISKSKRLDVTSLLNMSIADGFSSFSSSSGGKGAGTIDSELSETMLNKLLNSESFGSKVSNVILDTIKVNTAVANKGIFNSLYADEFNIAGGGLIYKAGVLYLDGKLSFENVEGGKEYVDSVVGEANQNVENLTQTLISNVENLQKQIDGQIETYYYDYAPTLNNIPASEWATDLDKTKHEGDLFYWKTKGFAYRFMKEGTVWKWQMIQDTDITLALEQASNAQDTADHKRRIFYKIPPDHPIPPYDPGDTWVQGEGGDILTCIYESSGGKGRLDGESYVSSDWVISSKYTDDSNLKLLEEALGCEKTTITKDWVFSPHITGGDISIGDKNGVYAQISSSGKLRCAGAEINGAITATSLTLGSGVTISHNNIEGLSNVATSGSFNDLTGTDNIIQADDINISTSIISNGLSKKTITVGTHSFDIIDGGDFVLLENVYGKETSDEEENSTTSYIKISQDGLLKAKNAVIWGDIYANNGYFIGEIRSGSTIKCGDNFSVDSYGYLTAKDVNLTGSITATKLTAQDCISIFYNPNSSGYDSPSVVERTILATNSWSNTNKDRTLLIGTNLNKSESMWDGAAISIREGIDADSGFVTEITLNTDDIFIQGNIFAADASTARLPLVKSNNLVSDYMILNADPFFDPEEIENSTSISYKTAQTIYYYKYEDGEDVGTSDITTNAISFDSGIISNSGKSYFSDTIIVGRNVRAYNAVVAKKIIAPTIVNSNGISVSWNGHRHNTLKNTEVLSMVSVSSENNFIPGSIDEVDYSFISDPGKVNLGSSVNYWRDINYSGALNKQSDRRKKNDFGDLSLDVSLTLLKNLKIKKFTYKLDESQSINYGIFAQDLRDLLKSSGIGYISALGIGVNRTEKYTTDINYPEDEVSYSVDYTQFIPVTIKGWQYHDEKIKYLESRIEYLEKQISQLKSK